MHGKSVRMVAIQIRGISEVTRRALSDEAKARGESLQEYLLDVLEREAQQIGHRRLLADWAASPSADAAQPIHAGEMIGSERENAPVLFVEQKTGLTQFSAASHTLLPMQGARKVG
jgi:antitoxin FitA